MLDGTKSVALLISRFEATSVAYRTMFCLFLSSNVRKLIVSKANKPYMLVEVAANCKDILVLCQILFSAETKLVNDECTWKIGKDLPFM